jgi:competence protein ComEC
MGRGWRWRHGVRLTQIRANPTGLRRLIADKILRALADKQYAGVTVALVVGAQRAIDQSDGMVFNRTGISHLISISGL